MMAKTLADEFADIIQECDHITENQENDSPSTTINQQQPNSTVLESDQRTRPSPMKIRRNFATPASPAKVRHQDRQNLSTSNHKQSYPFKNHVQPSKSDEQHSLMNQIQDPSQTVLESAFLPVPISSAVESLFRDYEQRLDALRRQLQQQSQASEGKH